MTALAARPTKSGSVIVTEYGVAVGFNREAATVNVTDVTVVGTVLKDDGDSTWSPVVAADVATIAGTKLAIVIDDYLYDVKETLSLPVDTTVAVLLPKTGVMIGKANLAFGDTLSAGQITTVQDELVDQGFVLVDQAPKA